MKIMKFRILFFALTSFITASALFGASYSDEKEQALKAFEQAKLVTEKSYPRRETFVAHHRSQKDPFSTSIREFKENWLFVTNITVSGDGIRSTVLELMIGDQIFEKKDGMPWNCIGSYSAPVIRLSGLDYFTPENELSTSAKTTIIEENNESLRQFTITTIHTPTNQVEREKKILIDSNDRLKEVSELVEDTISTTKYEYDVKVSEIPIPFNLASRACLVD